MRPTVTANIELNVDEIMALIEHCNTMAESIPKETYNDPTMAGGTFGETAEQYRIRAEKFYWILNDIWPK